MRQTVRALAILAAGLVVPAAASATTYEVTSASQLTTLIGTPTSFGTALAGDRIHIHRGPPYVAPVGGWVIRKPLEIFGDGPGAPFSGQGGSPDSSTWLQPANPTTPVLVVDFSGWPIDYLPNIYIHDLSIGQGIEPTPADSSNGIFCVNPSSKALTGFRLARVSVFNMGNDGIHLEGSNPGAGAIVGLSIEDSGAGFNRRHGLLVTNATVMTVVNGGFSENYGAGAVLIGCPGVHVIRTAFQGNQKLGGAWTAAQLFLESCHPFLVSGGHFEDFTPSTPNSPAISLSNCLGGYIGSNSFGTPSATGTTGIVVANMTKSIVVGPNLWADVDILVSVEDDTTVTSCTIQPQSIYSSNNVASKISVPEAVNRGHVVFSPVGNTSDLTAGFAFPRLTAAKRDAISAPASGGSRREGLFVYNDGTKRLNYWDGSTWRENVPFFPGGSAANAAPAGIVLPALSDAQVNSIPAAYRIPGALIFHMDDPQHPGAGHFQYWSGAAYPATGSGWKNVDRAN
jgi:hypothetical protein